MKTIVVWVLIFGYSPSAPTGNNSSIAIPGIASEDECRRLGRRIIGDAWLQPKFRCESYKAAATE